MTVPYIALVAMTYGVVGFWLSYVRMTRDERTPRWYTAVVFGAGAMTTMIWIGCMLGLKLGMLG